jgi:hypothetical protein
MLNATTGFNRLREVTLSKIGPIAGILTLASGCLAGDPDQPPIPLGAEPAPCQVSTGHYLIEAIELPRSASSAMQLGLDLDGDEQMRPDNAGGSLLSAFLSQYATGASDLDAAVASKLTDGRLRWVLAVETCADGNDAWTRVGVHRALDGDDDGLLELVEHPGPPAGGRLQGSMLRVEIGFGPVPLSAFVDVLDLDDSVEWVDGDGVMIEATFGDDGILEGKLGVGLEEDQLRATIDPRLAEFFTYKLGRGESEFAAELDEDADGIVTVDELDASGIMDSLVSPDVDLFDGSVYWPNRDGVKDRVSLGIGFAARPVAVE